MKKFARLQRMRVKNKKAIMKFRQKLRRLNRRMKKIKSRVEKARLRATLPTPLALRKGGKKAVAKLQLAELQKAFPAPKPKLDVKQKRDGTSVTKSNVKMGKPPVSKAKKGRMLVV